MFAKATRNFLREVDADGDLIAVSNLNDSDKLQLLSLVTKKKRSWCWQRPKYQVLSLTLGDVLIEDQFPSPVVVESDFVKYEGKFANHVSGTLETALGKVKLNVGGSSRMESQSSFGTLRKQEVDLQQLIRDSAERTINLRNPVLQQVLEGRNEVLCVLTQKITTMQKCVISEHTQVEEKCGGIVGIQTKTVQVSATEDGNVTKDSSVVLEIPAATTIAYGVIELYVKLDGQFEFCLLRGKQGGFENKRRIDSVYLDPLVFREFAFIDMPDAAHGISSQDGPLSVLKQVTPLLERNFHPFVELPEPQQTALSDIFQAVLFDDELLMVLEPVCDDLVSGLLPPMAVLGELKPQQQQDLEAFLQLVGCSLQGGCPGPEDTGSKQLFMTAYFLVGALAEMPDNVAALLGTCCKLQIIPTLCHLLRVLSDDGVSDLEDPTLAPLKDTERFGIVQRLFASADISLERLKSSVKAVILKDSKVFPLLLCIALNGLCALGREHS
ncbi:gasdermin-E isoform X1 [Rhinopithecus roxellana]|uniref:Gasdermin E n=2 Tax=Rhinopithecus roxellana TaxID=61622 RepID=A0A2K6QID1_RHIRO|nr:gasdermin-E isoform X1 [Rhinopithecus roxellana]XP_010374233.1 gasdermin-E isoform X1 [Rhinopithecus roxellana]XP_030788283.1 gasdermin-E isoform X1 [Rhinopithecus roxellana]XP_030788284.1 gasdermin-E isoform X1 [Rhinopithecus roxellana]